ncbi:hypothetical protein L3X38_011613 [Prunus dulcis]|uniref:Integrase catalytic domain-containing protein n=1 Tax=Prunus dulcis TaxID=3755 RepID=A0AAD4WK11_PRUDU|nr:hypothetical protein L3X38_011613 [Prunus dulcis]
MPTLQGNPWPANRDIPSTKQFMVIHAVGLMPNAPAKKEMMIVATDYFTKWIEAEALSSTKEVDVERFIWKNIICRFRCSQSIVKENGTHIMGRQISAFFAKYDIKQHLSNLRYSKSTGKTPFSLAYGTEAIILSHITVPSMSTEVGSLDQNCKQMKVNLDLLEEELEKAIVRVAAYQQQLTSYYNKKAIVRVVAY